MARVVIGIGSNLGDRVRLLERAARRIDALSPIVAASAVYDTEPVGGPPQGRYLNGAVVVDWNREPLELLDGLQLIENELGRVRGERWGPRTLDLDILWIEGVVIDEPRLQVPHPRLVERAFALAPLLAIAPDAVDPRTGERFRVDQPLEPTALRFW